MIINKLHKIIIFESKNKTLVYRGSKIVPKICSGIAWKDWEYDENRKSTKSSQLYEKLYIKSIK